MTDNKNKKKLDSKRVSLKQKYEVAYIKKRAKELLKLCTDELKNRTSREVFFYRKKGNHLEFVGFPISTLKKLTKALLKALKYKR